MLQLALDFYLKNGYKVFGQLEVSRRATRGTT
jgi:hypothetical protein